MDSEFCSKCGCPLEEYMYKYCQECLDELIEEKEMEEPPCFRLVY